MLRHVEEHSPHHVLRDWAQIYDVLPSLENSSVLDLGCGPGYQARDLAKRGARVVGVDINPERIEHATAQGRRRCEFIVGDMFNLAELGLGEFDGIWSSFAAAYCTDFEPILEHWIGFLKPGGWIALTEMSGLFDHEPLDPEMRDRLRAFYRERFELGTYDFFAGSKLGEVVDRSGLRTRQSRLVADAELSTSGPLAPAAAQSWERRLDRMNSLAGFFGSDFEAFRTAFLSAITSDEHTSQCTVQCVLATKPT